MQRSMKIEEDRLHLQSDCENRKKQKLLLLTDPPSLK